MVPCKGQNLFKRCLKFASVGRKAHKAKTFLMVGWLDHRLRQGRIFALNLEKGMQVLISTWRSYPSVVVWI